MVYAREAGIDWRDLVRTQLEQIGTNENLAKPMESRAFEIACLEQVLESFPDSVKDQEDVWCRATGKSRATFFRAKREFMNGNGEVG